MTGYRGPHQPPPLCAPVRPCAPIEARAPWYLGAPSGTDGHSWAHMVAHGRTWATVGVYRKRMSAYRGLAPLVLALGGILKILRLQAPQKPAKKASTLDLGPADAIRVLQKCHSAQKRRKRMSAYRGPSVVAPVCARVRLCAPIEVRSPWHQLATTGTNWRPLATAGTTGRIASRSSGVQGRQPLGKKSGGPGAAAPGGENVSFIADSPLKSAPTTAKKARPPRRRTAKKVMGDYHWCVCLCVSLCVHLLCVHLLASIVQSSDFF